MVAWRWPRFNFSAKAVEHSVTNSDFHSISTFVAAFDSILHQVANSIETLFVTDLPDQPSILPCPLPNLIDLSITRSGQRIELPYQLLNLRRLHVDACGHEVDYRSVTPVLEELKFSGICTGKEQFVVTILFHARCMVQGNLSPAFPVSTRRVILQQCAPHYDARGGNTNVSYAMFEKHLCIRAASVYELGYSTGFKLLLLPARTLEQWVKGKINGLEFSWEDARREWTNILFGSEAG